jgi:hypothetical protein
MILHDWLQRKKQKDMLSRGRVFTSILPHTLVLSLCPLPIQMLVYGQSNCYEEPRVLCQIRSRNGGKKDVDKCQADGQQKDGRWEQEANVVIPDAALLQSRVYQSVCSGGIPPEEERNHSSESQTERIENDGHPGFRIPPNDTGGQRNKRDREQQEEIQCEKGCVVALDVSKDVTMCSPVRPDNQKANDIAQDSWPEREEAW